jgi:DNA-binding winged helix-turn-helix (wHTH) protein
MREMADNTTALVFGDCTFDPGARTLLRDGRPVALTPKAFAFLELLLERRPHAVSKHEISDRLWPNTFVQEANLPNLAAEIRAALGDSSRASRCVRTLHGTGYAFCAPTEATGANLWICRLEWGDRALTLQPGDNVIGRDPQAQVVIPSSMVSRRHARIAISTLSATIEDLGSKNGTWIGPRRISGPEPLADHDEVQIGCVRMAFRRIAPCVSTETLGLP